MAEKSILLFGGEKNKWHDFDATGPIVAAIAAECGITCELTRNAGCFLPSRIKTFDMIAIMASSGTLSATQEDGLLAAVIGHPRGDTGVPKNLLCIHGATVLSSASGRYNRMIGARFLTHPDMGHELRIHVNMPEHLTMAGITDFGIVDELYLMETLSPFDTLLSTEYEGFHRPLAWVKPFGLGRVFYCALGHSPEQLSDTNVKRILANTMKWSAQ